MSSKYKTGEDAIPHFITFTVVGWIDVFSRECYKEILVKNLQYCIANKGLQLHAHWRQCSTEGWSLVSTSSGGLVFLQRDGTKKQIVSSHLSTTVIW